MTCNSNNVFLSPSISIFFFLSTGLTGQSKLGGQETGWTGGAHKTELTRAAYVTLFNSNVLY